MLTAAGVSARKGVATADGARHQLPVGDADRLRQPGRAAGEQDEAVAIVDVFGGRRCASHWSSRNTSVESTWRYTGFSQPVDVWLPRDPDVCAPGRG